MLHTHPCRGQVIDDLVIDKKHMLPERPEVLAFLPTGAMDTRPSDMTRAFAGLVDTIEGLGGWLLTAM